MDPLRVDIMGLTFKVKADRIVHRIERESGMAIDITGLRSSAITARAHLDRIKAAYARFNSMAPAHASDVEGLSDQIGGMQSDLEFAANLLGNSPPTGESLPAEARPSSNSSPDIDLASTEPYAGHPVMANIHKR